MLRASHWEGIEFAKAGDQGQNVLFLLSCERIGKPWKGFLSRHKTRLLSGSLWSRFPGRAVVPKAPRWRWDPCLSLTRAPVNARTSSLPAYSRNAFVVCDGHWMGSAGIPTPPTGPRVDAQPPCMTVGQQETGAAGHSSPQTLRAAQGHRGQGHTATRGRMPGCCFFLPPYGSQAPGPAQ